MQCSTLGNMSVTSRIRNVAFLGLLVSLSLFSDRCLGTAERIVDTDPHVVLEVGTRGILPCRVQTKAYSVEWKRQLSSETETLVFLDTYVYVGARDGPGYEAGLFNITDDYSLVIKDVKVQDEGLYICSVSDFKSGKPFENSTRVSVQAFPDEPFPVIQECIGKDGVCTLSIHQTSNLTCLVRGYYPDIDLFFLHGSEKVRSTGYEEWNNADGTKNKNIRVQVSVSNEPYKCVASSLLGIVENRSVSVIVHAQDSPPSHSQGPNVAAIVVPVLMIAGICLPMAVIVKCYLGNDKGVELRFMLVPSRSPVEGPVSKPELWKLVKKAKESDVFKKLRATLCCLRQLSETDASELKEDDDFYESLCEWKSETSSNPYQRNDLYFVCIKEGMSDLIRILEDFVRDTSAEVSRANINYILWGIGDPRKITDFVKALGLDHETVATACEEGTREVINMAQNELLKWRVREYDINPVVTLSLKLDELECEVDFFKLPLSQKEKIDVEEMKNICYKIFNQHFQSLLKVIRDNHGDLANEIKRFVEENNASLFDTVQMLKDWEQDEECSHYEKRRKLQEAVKAASQRDQRDAKWPPDDDLRVIASFLSSASIGELCSKLHTKSPPVEASHDQEKRFQILTEWRDNHASSKDLMEKHNELFTALKGVKAGGLVPRFKGPLVYKAELVDLAFYLFAQDLLPFTEALGISAAKLLAYRTAFQPSHLTKGTIGLVCKLCESGERSHLLKLLKEMPYPNVLASGMLALESSFGEVCAIFADRAHCQEKEKTRHPVKKYETFSSVDRMHDKTLKGITVRKTCSSSSLDMLDKSLLTEATYNEYTQEPFQAEICNETANGLKPLLTSALKIAHLNEVSPEYSTFMKDFKLWRKQPRKTPFNSRLAIANLRFKDEPLLISSFLRGEFNKGKIPFPFIDDILQTMVPKQRCILGNLIRDASFTPVKARVFLFPFKEEKLYLLEETVSRKIHTWTEEWMQQMIQTKWKKGKDGVLTTTQIAEEHKEFNDRLVEDGFFDLAYEIMISEQLLIDAHNASDFAY